MILLIGQVGRDMLEREAFQEIDYRQMFQPMAKWVAQIDRAERIPELLARAFTVATRGRPGAVVLALPEDMLVDEVDGRPAPVPAGAHASRARRSSNGCASCSRRGAAARDRRRRRVERAAAADIVAFGEANALPVATSFRRQDYVDNRSRVYVGHVGVGIDPALAARVAEADLLLVVGPRLGEMTTGGYTLVEPPLPRQTLVHVHPGAEELGRVYQPRSRSTPARPSSRPPRGTLCVADTRSPPRTGPPRRAPTTSPRSSPSRAGRARPERGDGRLRERLPEDAIICNGAGNFTAWPHRFWQFTGYRSQLAPTSGAMGYGVPAAVAAKIVHPDRPSSASPATATS